MKKSIASQSGMPPTRTHVRIDGQPENMMPLAPSNGWAEIFFIGNTILTSYLIRNIPWNIKPKKDMIT